MTNALITKWNYRIASILCLLLFSSCTDSSTTAPSNTVPASTDTSTKPPSDSGTSEAQNSASTVSLHVRSWDEVQEKVLAQQGKVVVIDIWLSTCLTCVEEFPKFVELQREFGEEKLVCLSVNCDYDGIDGKPPEYFREKVLSILTENKAEFDNTALNISCLDLLETIDLSSTPAYLVYGTDGKLVKRFDNDNAATVEDEFKFADVEDLVQQLLSGKSP